MAKLCVALDFDNLEKMHSFVVPLRSSGVVLKIGLGLLPLLGLSDLQKLLDQGFEIFIDAKLHDIPSQVGRAVATWAQRGVHYLTLHCSGGPAMIQSALAAAKGSSLKLLGVTLLTSLSDDDVRAMKIGDSAKQRVLINADVSLKAGLSNFVCSVSEVADLRALASQLGTKAFTVTPGLFWAAAPSADQSRTFSVHEALAQGSDLLVVGRSILEAKSPLVVVEEINAEIQRTKI